MKVYPPGHDLVPAGIQAGGLRYHGDSALISQLRHEGLHEAQAYGQIAVFQSAMTFARSEGILPAPESAHAIHSAILEAKRADAEGKQKTIHLHFRANGF